MKSVLGDCLRIRRGRPMPLQPQPTKRSRRLLLERLAERDLLAADLLAFAEVRTVAPAPLWCTSPVALTSKFSVAPAGDSLFALEGEPPPNDPTTAVNDLYFIDEDAFLLGNVLDNDSDPNGDTLTAALVTSPARGFLTFDNNGEFTYTPDPNFSGMDEFFYRIDDGAGGESFGTVTIIVEPVNDAPGFDIPSGGYSYSVQENSAAATTIGSVTASDLDGDTLTFSLVDGNASGFFAIDAATGEIRVASGAALDYETTPSYTLTVQVADPLGLYTTTTVEVAVENVNEAPVFDIPSGGYSYSVQENSAAATTIGSVTASDPDGDTLTFSLVDGNASGFFEIDAATGEICVASGAALDYETTPSYTLTVQVADPLGLYTTTTVEVAVENVNEAPAIMGFAASMVDNELTVSGTVTDDEIPVGMFVMFGGLLAGESVVVTAGGGFIFSKMMPSNSTGAVSAQFTDAGALASEEVQDFV